MLRSQIFLFVLMLGFLGNWFEFLGVSIRKADSLHLICTLPKIPGHCKTFTEMYYYDNWTRQCEKFIYGGCGGNANRFRSLSDCNRKCYFGWDYLRNPYEAAVAGRYP